MFFKHVLSILTSCCDTLFYPFVPPMSWIPPLRPNFGAGVVGEQDRHGFCLQWSQECSERGMADRNPANQSILSMCSKGKLHLGLGEWEQECRLNGL